MADKFLQEFLKTGLFDIGDSDDRLKWLQQSIADLQKKFEKNYSLLPKFTLVALDPNISDTDPVMIETESIITTHWKALRGKYTEMPRNLIRGVILNALHNVGIQDPFPARIIYLTGLNFYPYAKLNSEKDLVCGMFVTLGEIAEKHAGDEWAFTEEAPRLKLSPLKVGSLNFGTVSLDAKQLKEKLEEAFTNSETGHGPQHGLHEANYQAHFVTKTTNAIATSFNSAMKGLNSSLSSTDIETSMNKFFTEFKKSLDTNLKSSFASLTAVERRSKLLWWKETLYSPSQKRGYREFDKNILPILMAADLSEQIPEITPISVDYLLIDTLLLLNEKLDEKTTFSDYLPEVSTNENKLILKSYFENVTEREGRISLTDFIALLVNDRIKIGDFKKKTGINIKESFTLGDLSVAVLHDFLVQKLITK